MPLNSNFPAKIGPKKRETESQCLTIRTTDWVRHSKFLPLEASLISRALAAANRIFVLDWAPQAVLASRDAFRRGASENSRAPETRGAAARKFLNLTKHFLKLIRHVTWCPPGHGTAPDARGTAQFQCPCGQPWGNALPGAIQTAETTQTATAAVRALRPDLR